MQQQKGFPETVTFRDGKYKVREKGERWAKRWKKGGGHLLSLEGIAVTYFTAKEGNAQGDIIVALSMQALDMPTDTFIHIAIIPNQEAAKQKCRFSGKPLYQENSLSKSGPRGS